jgi:ATP-dependent Lon protease
MMTEKELIGKIRELRQIKPNKDWVSLTKSQILGEEVNQHRVLVNLFRPAYAGLIVVFVLFGLFGFSQNSLPGDLLYPIKKITEKSQAVFVSEKELPKYNLEIANKRLDELTEIAQTNQVKKLAPAISEFQANISEAAKSLVKVKGQDVEKIVAQTKKLEENKKKVEEVLATKIETEELDNALAQLVESQIKDLEERTLTEEQMKIFAEAKEDFEAGNYSDALIKILILSQP